MVEHRQSHTNPRTGTRTHARTHARALARTHIQALAGGLERRLPPPSAIVVIRINTDVLRLQRANVATFHVARCMLFGLDVVRQVSQVAMVLGRPGASLMLEHGQLQGADIREILSADGWRASATHRDLTGRDRYTTATRP